MITEYPALPGLELGLHFYFRQLAFQFPSMTCLSFSIPHEIKHLDMILNDLQGVRNQLKVLNLAVDSLLEQKFDYLIQLVQSFSALSQLTIQFIGESKKKLIIPEHVVVSISGLLTQRGGFFAILASMTAQEAITIMY